jgi:hypothetical protein
MIIKGGSRQNRRFFTKHLLNTKENERVRVVEFQGCANEDVDLAFRDMEAAAKGTRCENYFYQVSMSPGENERLTDEQWERAVDITEEKLGLAGQPRFVIEHEKKGRVHRHVVWSRIDADTMTARSDSLTYQKHEAAAREIERECGLQPVASVLVKGRDTPRPERHAKDYEGFRAVRTGLNPDQVKAEVTALWQQTDNGAAFRAALYENGYILCQGDRRDFCIVDPAGDEHSLARRISGVRAAEVRERLKDIDRDSLPTVAEGRELANMWGDSEAARAVRNKEFDNRLKAPLEAQPVPEWQEKQQAFMEHMRRVADWEKQPQWSPLEKAGKEYGDAVKGGARAAQSAYWLAMKGIRLKTEADRWHEMLMGTSEGQSWADRMQAKENHEPDIER